MRREEHRKEKRGELGRVAQNIGRGGVGGGVGGSTGGVGGGITSGSTSDAWVVRGTGKDHVGSSERDALGEPNNAVIREQ